MTTRLILIRHAKSSWGDAFADDHARVLNKRGQATAIGGWLGKNSYLPDVILCSDAARTQETAGLILPHLVPAPQLQPSPMLYHAAPDTILDLLTKQHAKTIAVIGHNPGIGMLAMGLAANPPTHHRFSDYPTCATTIMDFDVTRWIDVDPGMGHVVDFVVPRDLIGHED